MVESTIWLGVGATALAFSAPITAAIIKLLPGRGNSSLNSTQVQRLMTKELCTERYRGIGEKLTRLEKGQEDLGSRIGEVHDIVLKLGREA